MALNRRHQRRADLCLRRFDDAATTTPWRYKRLPNPGGLPGQKFILVRETPSGQEVFLVDGEPRTFGSPNGADSYARALNRA